jgi:hypothetical protein
MSGEGSHKVLLPKALLEFSLGIIRAEAPAELVKANKALIDNITPGLVLSLVDRLVEMEIPMPELKRGVNKLLNLFHDALNHYPSAVIQENSFPDFLQRNNAEMDRRLKEMRPLIRQINKNHNDLQVKKQLLKGFSELEAFEHHYVLKENVLFPMLEKQWTNYRCLKIMWSLHDDIRRDRKNIVGSLKKVELNLKKFNKLAGDLYFNMYAIKFREEKILFPLMMRSIDKETIEQLLPDSSGLPWPFFKPEIDDEVVVKTTNKPANEISLGTGMMTVKQIKLLFNHLPVDITYVDEHNKVKYFSASKKRIFPRAKGVIGRDVKNCHPPESVHVVEEIIEEFRRGTQDKASFWINMGPICVLIQYFAVRDPQNRYCGVVEVSQEISEIKKIEGEQRLLDWKK